MTEATCPPTQAYTNTFVSNTSVTVPVVITTTGRHQIATNHLPGKHPYTFAALAGLLLFAFPTIRRKRWAGVLLLFVSIALVNGCGNSVTRAPPPPSDAGTPAGAYTVTITATSAGITRTATFTATVLSEAE